MQWDIVRLAFGEGATLVLIGDPKQAIYAFRGADVYAYLEAARTAGASATLEVNWRSDQGLLEAYDALFGNARLGHEGIAYRSVRAAAANREPRLLGAPRPEPLRMRVVHRDDPTVDKTRYGYAGNDSSRRHIATDLAGDLVGAAVLGRADRAPRRGRRGARAGARAAGPRRRAGAHAPPGGARARGARRGRDPGGDQRRRQRVRLRAGARLAAAAGGDRAPERGGARPRRGADAVPGLGRGAGRVGGRGGVGGGPPPPARVGARAARARASRRCSRRSRSSRACPAGCSPRSTASAT